MKEEGREKEEKNEQYTYPFVLVKSSQVINPLNAFCIVQRADRTSQKKCVLQDYGVFSVAPPTLVGWADCM